MTAPTDAPPRSAAAQAQLVAMVTELFEQRINFNQLLGLHADALAGDGVQVSFAMQPQWLGHQSHSRLHGGVISAVIDAACGLAVMMAIAERHPADNVDQVMQRITRLSTIDLRVDYLRQGIGKRFVTQATVIRLGGRVGSIQARMSNDEGTLIATGAAAYIVS